MHRVGFSSGWCTSGAGKGGMSPVREKGKRHRTTWSLLSLIFWACALRSTSQRGRWPSSRLSSGLHPAERRRGCHGAWPPGAAVASRKATFPGKLDFYKICKIYIVRRVKPSLFSSMVFYLRRNLKRLSSLHKITQLKLELPVLTQTAPPSIWKGRGQCRVRG